MIFGASALYFISNVNLNPTPSWLKTVKYSTILPALAAKSSDTEDILIAGQDSEVHELKHVILGDNVKAVEEETARKAAEEEAARKAAEEEASRKAAEEEAVRKAAEEEAATKAAEEEAARKAAEEEAAKKTAEEEATKKTAEEEAAKKTAEEEAAKKTAAPSEIILTSKSSLVPAIIEEVGEVTYSTMSTYTVCVIYRKNDTFSATF